MSDAYLIRSQPGLSYRLPRRALWAALCLAGLTVALCLLSLMTGSYPLSATQVVATLSGAAPTEMAATVVWEFRFPRTLVAAMAGACFALSGGVLQSVTRNPLADPSLVGVSQGAGLAVVAILVMFPETDLVWRPVMAFGGAVAVAALVQLLAAGRGGGQTMRFILSGIGVAAFLTACTSVLLTYGDLERAQAALGWLAGSIHAAGWDEVALLGGALVLLAPGLALVTRPLSALRMGPEVAIGLGLRVVWLRPALVTLAVALAAVAVAAVGPLGFVGLIAPHAARRLARAGMGLHLVLSALVGALLVGLADLAGRALFGWVQIPAGIVTAILGVPLFVWLLIRHPGGGQL